MSAAEERSQNVILIQLDEEHFAQLPDHVQRTVNDLLDQLALLQGEPTTPRQVDRVSLSAFADDLGRYVSASATGDQPEDLVSLRESLEQRADGLRRLDDVLADEAMIVRPRGPIGTCTKNVILQGPFIPDSEIPLRIVRLQPDRRP